MASSIGGSPKYVRQLELPSLPAKVQRENRLLWNDGRTMDGAQFFTIGYAGKTLNETIELLQCAHVSTLIDVRFAAFSMYKRDFNKAQLAAALSRAGIDYVHLPQLGVPRDIRAKAIHDGHRGTIWAWYDEHVLAGFLRNFNTFLNVGEHPVALMCVELDPGECHRHRISLKLEEWGLQGFEL